MNEELKAIQEVSDQVKGFKEKLGEKADKTEFDKVSKQIAELSEGVKSWKESKVEDTIKSINGSIEKFSQQVNEMQEDIAAQKDKGSKGGNRNKLFSTDDVKSFVEKTFKDNRKSSEAAAIKFDANIKGVYRAKTAEDFSTEDFFNGAADTVSDVFTGRFIDPTLYQRKRKRNLILDNWMIESITVPKLFYMEKKEVAGDVQSQTDVGAANFISGSAQKPKRSFRVTTGSVEAKKVAIFGTLEDKLLRDVPSLEAWVREDFVDEMIEEYNDKLVNGDATGDDPLGLKENAITYTATDAFDASISSPNEIDCIVAACAYMSTLKEQPGKVFVSSDLYYKLHILKDGQGRYQNQNLVYVSNTGQLYICGVPVIVADDEDVPSTHLLLTSVDPGFKIKNYGPMVFERGLNGEDFRYDRTSFRGYQEVLSYIPEHRYNSVLYDTFENITTAITTGS